MMQRKGLEQNPEITRKFKNGGGVLPIITSGLLPSWVILPTGPWSLPTGWELGTPCSRSAVADTRFRHHRKL